MSFNDLKLNPDLLKILNGMDIIEPTEIQRLTFPSACNGKDVIGISKTGSGKTLAFLLPILQQIMLSDKPFHALIIVPTRELAQQIADTLRSFESLNIRHALLSGGENFGTQVSSVNKKPHIIVGTPGRIVLHIQKNKNLRLDRIRKLIFDEADRFFEMDFVSDLEIIKEKLVKLNQALMFTATLTSKLKKLAGVFMRSPKIIGNENHTESLINILEYMVIVPEKYKLTCLFNYLKSHSDSIILFVAMCSDSHKIGTTLQNLGLSCDFLHGKMPQTKRDDVIKRFRDQEFSILVSTDLASRGLDIPHVGLVVNYDLPDSAKLYVHRIGRTARAEKHGISVSFVTQYDVEKIQRIEIALNRKLEVEEYGNYNGFDDVKDAFSEVVAEFNSNKKFKF